jgi:hypothetical protein
MLIPNPGTKVNITRFNKKNKLYDGIKGYIKLL